MAGQVKDSLLVRTILSPQFDLADATVVHLPRGDVEQGTINKQTLVNRVKKLDQKDRQALMTELQFMSLRMGTLTQLQPANLPERGLSTLLLADDTTRVKTHNFFVSFWRFLANTFGDRISSKALIKQFETVRNELIDPNKQALTTADNVPVVLDQVVPALETRARELQAAIAAPIGNEKLQAAKDKLKDLDGQVLALLEDSNQNPLNLMRLLASIRGGISGLQEYVKSDTAVFDGTRQALFTPLQGISELIGELNKAKCMADVAQYIIDHFPLTEEQTSDLRAILDGTKVATEKKDKSYWIGNLLVPHAHIVFKMIFSKMNQEMNAGEERKVRNTMELASVTERLARFQRDLELAGKGRLLEKALLDQETSEIVLTTVGTVQQLVAELDNPNDDSLLNLKSFVELLQDSDEYDSAKALPASGNPAKTFGESLTYILHVLTNNASTLGALKASIQTEVYLADMDDQTLRQRLSSFVAGQVVPEYDLATDQGKKAFVKDYVAYLKIVFEAKKRAAEADFSTKELAVSQLDEQMEALLTKTPEALVPVVSNPVVPAPVLDPDAALPLVPLLASAPIVSTNGIAIVDRELVVPLANGLQQARGSEVVAKSYYDKVSLLPPAVKQSVYQNFYYIMNSASEIALGDMNWGEIVFQAHLGWDNKVKKMSVTKLNHFRVQAMNLTIRGVTRTS